MLGMSFRDNKQFKEFARAYKLKHGYGIKLSKNEKARVRYKCVEGCPWKVSAGLDKEANFWISVLYDTHTCIRSFHSKQVSAHWGAEKYVDQFQTNIEFKAKDLVAAMGRDVIVQLALSKAYRARDIARGMVRGDFCEQFTKVRRCCAKLRRSNPGTMAKVIVAIPYHNFKRVYMCLVVCKEGFVSHCRPLISLVACHLKGVVASQLLVAVGIDGNDTKLFMLLLRQKMRRLGHGFWRI